MSIIKDYEQWIVDGDICKMIMAAASVRFDDTISLCMIYQPLLCLQRF